MLETARTIDENYALRVRRPLPAKSVHNAASAFRDFSLSRFAKTPTPANYVPTAQAKLPSAVAAVQREAMTKQTAALAANPPQTPWLTVALTPASLAQLLPSLDANANTVDLTHLSMTTKLSFYAPECRLADTLAANWYSRSILLVRRVHRRVCQMFIQR